MEFCSPRFVEGHDLASDPVMKDLRENFREEDVVKDEGEGSGFGRQLLVWVVIVVVALLFFWTFW